MSNLEELIEKLCPDGVEFCKLKDVAEIGTGSSDRKNATDDGLYPFYVRSKDVLKINNYEFDEEAIVIPGEGGIGEIFHLVKGKYALHQRAYRIHLKNKNILTSFLYYYMKSNFKTFINKKAVSATVTSIRKPMIEEFKLPVPPLEVQREIVRILDNFTFLTTELAAELAARQKQYEYYRDKLLTPKAEIKTVELGEVCTFVRGPFGGALKKEIFKPHGYAVYEQQHAIYRTLDFRYFIDKKKFDELKRFSIKPGDMIVSCSGTIGKTFIIPEDAPEGVINQALLKLTPHDELNVFYLQYFFENTISKELNGVARGGAIKNVPSVSELKAIKIPVPSLDVQERLVQVLDNFDAICSDLNIGLPAEIEACQKQYEYYRDKLLTFKELKKEA